MSLDQVLSSLPPELGATLGQITRKPIVVAATSSNNIAKDHAVQVCGPVAGRIEYVLNFSVHYHAGERNTCCRLTGGDLPMGRRSKLESSLQPSSTGTWTEEWATKGKSLPDTEQPLSLKTAQTSRIQKIHFHSQRQDAMPVLATIDPNIEGNWIAARIVIRLRLRYKEAADHKNVPNIKGKDFRKTKIFVDLSCGNSKDGLDCKHRFYVVNHCDDFDLLFGTG